MPAAAKALLDEAHETIRQLKEELLCGGAAIYEGFYPTMRERIFLDTLAKSPTAVSAPRMASIFNLTRGANAVESDIRIMVHNVRLKLKEHEIQIENRRGDGYWLSGINRARLRALRVE